MDLTSCDVGSHAPCCSRRPQAHPGSGSSRALSSDLYGLLLVYQIRAIIYTLFFCVNLSDTLKKIEFEETFGIFITFYSMPVSVMGEQNEIISQEDSVS